MTGPALIDPLRKARNAVRFGQFREAKTELEALRNELHSSPEWMLLLAMTTWRLGDFGSSLTVAAASLDVYRQRADSDGEMRAQNVAAAGLFALGELSSARDGFEKALALAEQRDDLVMIARCANNLGNVAFYLGRNEQALRWYRQAARVFEQFDSLQGIAWAWHNIGTVLREDGAARDALAAADRALDAAERLGDPRSIGWALGGRGETNVMLGDLRLGEAEVGKALSLSREQEDRPTEIEALRNLSMIAQQNRQLERALDLIEQAVELADRVKSRWLIAGANRDLGRILRRLNKIRDADEAVKRSAIAFRLLGAVERSEAVLREAGPASAR